jgi:hypothetical protein
MKTRFNNGRVFPIRISGRSFTPGKCCLSILALFLLSIAPVTGNAQTPAIPLKAADYIYDSLDVGQPLLDLKNQTWTVQAAGSNRQVPVRVGESILHQGLEAGEYTYRTTFTLPALREPTPLYLLNLGPISAADVTQINGQKIGAYGAFPGTAPIHGSSWAPRRYPVAASSLHFGATNELEVRVQTGVWGGIYQGPLKLSPLKQQVLIDYALRDAAVGAVTPLLSEASHLNHIYGNEPLALRLRVADFLSHRVNNNATLKLNVSQPSGTIVHRHTLPLRLQPQAWTEWTTINFPALPPGDYSCSVVIEAGGQTLTRRQFSFSKQEQRPDLSQKGIAISQTQLASLHWRSLSENAVGSYGARNILTSHLNEVDPRGNLAFTSRVEKNSNRVLLFQNEVQKTPKTPYPVEYYQKFGLGREYDGFDTLWPFGFVRLGNKHSTAQMGEATWTSRTYRWQESVQKPTVGELTVSKLSPAFRLLANTSEIGLFESLADWGLSGPSHIAYMSESGITVQKNGSQFSASQMKANWLLVWFQNSTGWNHFDIPWLVVLENKSDLIELNGEGLKIGNQDNRSVGRIWGMPLFGVRLLPKSETAAWNNSPAQIPLSQIQQWSRSLLAYPRAVQREVALDYAANDTYLRETFTFETVEDAWGTQPLPAAPVAPALAINLVRGKLGIQPNTPLTDYRLTTLFGPYLAASHQQAITYRIPRLLQLVREMEVIQKPNAAVADAAQLQKTLDEAVLQIIEKDKLEELPWPSMFAANKLQQGYIQPNLSYLISTIPLLSPKVATRLRQAITNATEHALLPVQLPASHWNSPLKERVVGTELFTRIYEPITRKHFLLPAQQIGKRGTDQPFAQALQLLSLDQVAYNITGDALLRQHWPVVEEMYNLLPHSHDWAILQIWDYLSGYRIGNGLQEGGAHYAGFAAMARIADRMNKPALRDQAASYAVMQLLGMNAAMNGIDYFRIYRPWSSNNQHAADISEGESTLKHRYVEFNEFGGSSVNQIGPHTSMRSTSSYIHFPMPEVMRPYPLLWKTSNDYFFASLYHDAPLDMVSQMEMATPERVRVVASRQLTSHDPLERALAARMLLNNARRNDWETVMPATQSTGVNNGS